MKKILMMILMFGGLHAGTFATVDCTEMSKVIELLQGYTKVCQVDTDVHSFKQEFNIEVTGTIEYEDGGVLGFVTINKILTVNIEADRPFVIKTDNFMSTRFKLSLLSDGAESWKYFYDGTSRWRTYDFATIMLPTEVVIINEPIIIEPPIIVDAIPEGNVTSIVYDFSSFYSKDDEFLMQSRILHEDTTPFVGVRVQVIVGDTTHEAVTDNLGVFEVLMTIGTPFTLRAFNTLSIPHVWSEYEKQLVVTKDGNVIDAPI